MYIQLIQKYKNRYIYANILKNCNIYKRAFKKIKMLNVWAADYLNLFLHERNDIRKLQYLKKYLT
jgi:hypothetical protein